MTTPRFMNEKDAASYLCISTHTLRCYRSRGKGPSYSKLGRAVRYEQCDLDEWANAQMKVGKSSRSEGK